MSTITHMAKDKAVKIHSEIAVDNFSAMDCDLSFYSFIRAIMLRYGSKSVLDYGAGRNRYEQDFAAETSSYLLRDLRDFRVNGAHVTAVDVADEVMGHPTSDAQSVIDPAQPLPFADNSFDLIVSDYVFEHVEDPAFVARELQRVLKPGGWIAARTPNKFSYLRVAAGLTANRLHDAVLKYVQPNRKSVDTFPTFYRLNSRADIARSFEHCTVSHFTDSWEPAYFFGSPVLYRVFLLVHRLLPSKLGTATVFLLQKK